MPIIWLVSTLLAAIVGSSKGRSTAGFFLGLFFGPLGLLAVCGMAKKENKK